jgi:hypothetical protein
MEGSKSIVNAESAVWDGADCMWIFDEMMALVDSSVAISMDKVLEHGSIFLSCYEYGNKTKNSHRRGTDSIFVK